MAMSFGIDGDVKFQQLVFLSELQLFGKQATGFHYRFFRYAYGGFFKGNPADVLRVCGGQVRQEPPLFLAPPGEGLLEMDVRMAHAKNPEENGRAINLKNLATYRD